MKRKGNILLSQDIWSDAEIASKILERIKEKSGVFFSVNKRKPSFMEVCGTHTMAIARSGIRNLIGNFINLVSGPGCPVCVTSQGDIDRVVEFSKFKDVIITTFGDMIKVKGSNGNDLSKLRMDGVDVRVVYSPLDALNIAVENPRKNVVFIGVGFETTAPLIAGTIKIAYDKGISNFYVASLFKLVPPALRFLLDSGVARIDGFILPGHVSVIIGSKSYNFLEKNYNIPSVISGFEPIDILRSIDLLMDFLVDKKSMFAVEYERAVEEEGNKAAISLMNEVFVVSDAYWRAIGVIKNSGYSLSKKYERFDAFKKYSIEYVEKKEPEGCLCGKILLGIRTPVECRLFGKRCTPEDAVGPCMVSSEGACAAWYKYGIRK